MIWYVRISTPLCSACVRAFGSGRTLKPRMIAPDASASVTSFSVIAGFRSRVEPEHLRGASRSRFVQRLSVVVEHRAHASPRGAAHDDVAHAQRSALHEDGGHRPAPLIEVRFDDHAAGRGFLVRL